jgi:sec-independent protein translocase protein TatB
MFNIGFGELAVICIVLIIAVGPERLPSMMKTLGKTLRTLRQASRDIRASTGIDDLMREDFDFNAPPRRPYVPPVPPPPAAEQPVSRAELPAAIHAPDAAEPLVYPARAAQPLPSDANVAEPLVYPAHAPQPLPPLPSDPAAAKPGVIPLPPPAEPKPPHES